jgi:hypothetical protein
MATIGLIAMSAKPYHIGHDMMVRRASQECDEVHLYISTTDRKRAGDDVPILGTDMMQLWKDTIEPSLPSNVKVVYGGSPVGNIWKDLGGANEAASKDTYVIYADADDLAQNFTENLLQKYSGNLFQAGQIKLAATERAFSGTKMRAFLAAGDKENFVKHLPAQIDRDKVWDVLSATAKNPPAVKTTAGPTRKPAAAKKPGPPAKKTRAEGMLRRYVRLLLGV